MRTAVARPIAIDLYCGLGGWAEGLLAAGFRVVGFDVERHAYCGHAYPGSLVLQDVLTLHGSQFKDAALIVASPPCTEFSYMAMPWRRAKRIAAALRGEGDFPEGYRGSRTRAELTALFDACFRIREEASAATGRRIPLVVENVRGAQPWVGRAEWAYGSYYLWGDVPALMPITAKRAAQKNQGHTVAAPTARGKWAGNAFPHELMREGVKRGGFSWSDYGKPGYVPTAFNGAVGRKNGGDHGADAAGNREARVGEEGRGAAPCADHIKLGRDWGDAGTGWHANAQHASRSPKHKAASALIAKIPHRLALHIGEVYFPLSRKDTT